MLASYNVLLDLIDSDFYFKFHIFFCKKFHVQREVQQELVKIFLKFCKIVSKHAENGLKKAYYDYFDL